MRPVLNRIAALFVDADSVYKSISECDCYDAERNALTFRGGMAIVAHPPCRAWCKLRRWAKPLPGEPELATWAVDMVQTCGGVLEHPSASKLWPAKSLPLPNMPPDEFGGFTLRVEQIWWGHRARKATWLYICGMARKDVPAMPLSFDLPTHSCSSGRDRRPQIRRRERSATPPRFAEWLVSLARLC